MERRKLLLIGNGMSGIRCIEEILKLDPDLFDITVIGSEPRPNYNRILLSKVLQGEHSFQEIILNDWNWYEEHRITLLAGEIVRHIDTKARYVDTVSGIRKRYDVLIIATGSTPFIPPIHGTNIEGVISFRTLDDCNRMTELSRSYSRAAVIGGGLLGLEAARGLLHLGMETEVIHNAPYIMNRQLDPISARMLQRELEKQGMRFHLSKNTTRIAGRTRVQSLRFSDGTQLDADVVVIAVGIRPNIELAQKCGLHTNRAIVVDDFMRTSAPDVYAVGECAEHRGISYGLVAPLYEQGKVLARAICGLESESYNGSIPYSQLKVSGVDVFSAGEITGDDSNIAYQNYDAIQGTYKKVMMAEGKVTGAILFGDTSEGTTLLGMVKKGASVAELIPDEASGNDNASAADKAAATLPDQETVCACNGVSKHDIMTTIVEHGLNNADEVKVKTKASGSCGGCRPMVEALVHFTLRGSNGRREITNSESNLTAKSAALPVCDCTDLSHELLKKEVQKLLPTFNVNSGHTEIINLMNYLGWKRGTGCILCRTSIRYYLELLGLGADREIDSYSLLKEPLYRGVRVLTGELDGTGGSVVQENLYRIAQRLRSEWEYISLPYPLQAAVTESTDSAVSVLVQGIGICSSPAGFEVYLGGHAKHPVCEGQLMGVAEDVEEAVRLATACLQWYRQTATYEEPLWNWVKRVGVISIRENVLRESMVC
ncbi:nitrite reductase (NADH) large subunit [Fontibacillus panacisegetis]|uniref:Nitrite reductase (NADH) large subunit n=1 Tax=Fontibacillus panacisegetis TaxID=670482 RepID=A0A1G7E9N4_9BACL|nr:nitrite reductase large subunit NirB [Fontibacillus panacisegetis]SDE60105.1 nitrite reductase (NADH) large subunit [Fontibacillus panacisegetis]